MFFLVLHIKVRSEAVTKLHQMIKDSKPITSNLGELPVVLAARIADSNSKISVASIQLVETLAEAMGPQCKQHTRTFLPALIKLIGDPKVCIICLICHICTLKKQSFEFMV